MAGVERNRGYDVFLAVMAAIWYVLYRVMIAAAGVGEDPMSASAAADVMIGRTRTYAETPKYLLVRPYDDAAWDASWNDLHYVTAAGDANKKYVAYCLESHKASPSGQTYVQVGRPDYSAPAERGLKAIFRMGYPYSNIFGDAGEYELNDTDAQAATQIAIRFWMSYRQTIDTDLDYHVIKALNPYGNNVKPASGVAAQRVYAAALWLFHLAENGASPTFGLSAELMSSGQPQLVGETTRYFMTVRVNLSEKKTDIPCDYAVVECVMCGGVSVNDAAVEITSSAGAVRTDGLVRDGDQVNVSWPADAAVGGREATLVLAGVSGSADISLLYMGTSDSSVQKLFVTRLDEGTVARAEVTVYFHTPLTPTPTSTPTPTPTPTPTSTPIPTVTPGTSSPTPTNTPPPNPTSTPEPTVTPGTTSPTPTNTPPPTPTSTPVPTVTPGMSATVTPEPTLTAMPLTPELKPAVPPEAPSPGPAALQSPQTDDALPRGKIVRIMLAAVSMTYCICFIRMWREVK